MRQYLLEVIIAVIVAVAAAAALAGCDGPLPTRDATPTRVICTTGNTSLYNGVVPRHAVRPCYWDLGHKALCVTTPLGELVFGPAFPCAIAPEIQPPAQATAHPSPTPEPQAKGKRKR